jgi:AcrR family transcriptional regulator
MQVTKSRTPNSDRSAAMRARLMDAARALFVERGYAETSTPEVVRAAGVTRGALYHHFADKLALFDAVVAAEAEALTLEIERASEAASADSLGAGTSAFFDAMAEPGRARLLLVDGPAVLGRERMDDIDAGHGRRSLRAGLAATRPDLSPETLDAMSAVLSAAFDRAALDIAEGANDAPYLEALMALMAGAGSPRG